ncbi:hypothetical protein D3C72_2259140 [compost metagenome]
MKKACDCRSSEARPGGTPTSMPMNRKENFTTHSMMPMPMMIRHGTSGLGMKKTSGTAAKKKRRAENSSGGKLSSPSLITTKLKPQSAATSTSNRT